MLFNVIMVYDAGLIWLSMLIVSFSATGISDGEFSAKLSGISISRIDSILEHFSFRILWNIYLSDVSSPIRVCRCLSSFLTSSDSFLVDSFFFSKASLASLRF